MRENTVRTQGAIGSLKEILCKGRRRLALAAAALFIGMSGAVAGPIGWSVDVALPTDGTIYFNIFTGYASTMPDPGYDYTYSINNFAYPTTPPVIQTVINAQNPDNKVVNDGPDCVSFFEESEFDGSGSFWSGGNIATYDPTRSSPYVSNFNPGDTSFIGLKFFDANNNVHYGWASFVVEGDSTLVTLKGFGYESTPGAAITIGAVPEPSTLGLLAAAGAGLVLAWRARRRA